MFRCIQSLRFKEISILVFIWRESAIVSLFWKSHGVFSYSTQTRWWGHCTVKFVVTFGFKLTAFIFFIATFAGSLLPRSRWLLCFNVFSKALVQRCIQSMIVDDSQNYHQLSNGWSNGSKKLVIADDSFLYAPSVRHLPSVNIDYHARGQTGKTIINYHEEFNHSLAIINYH